MTAAPPASSTATGAMNRYPRRGTVSMNRGFAASSPSAARSLARATPRLLSNSTNVSPGHNRWRSSSRLTSPPGRSSSAISHLKGLLLQPDRLALPTQTTFGDIRFKDSESVSPTSSHGQAPGRSRAGSAGRSA